MTRAVLSAIRTVLRRLSPADGEVSRTELWTPVSQESTDRKVSAPVPWLCAVTDIGKSRRSNQDDYFLSKDCTLWVVADGVGGHAAGEVASMLTIQAIAEVMDSAGTSEERVLGDPRGTTSASVSMSSGESLMRAFAEAQERVLGRSRKDPRCQEMGSTVIAGLLRGDALHICHAGDTRGYHFSQGQLRCLTNDHSFVWNLVRAGLLTPDQARVHPHRGTITQAIGMHGGVRPDVTSVNLAQGDRVLLCSDGLWEALADSEIEMILGQNGSMLEVASTLVERANASSGRDNITAVLYKH